MEHSSNLLELFHFVVNFSIGHVKIDISNNGSRVSGTEVAETSITSIIFCGFVFNGNQVNVIGFNT